MMGAVRIRESVERNKTARTRRRETTNWIEHTILSRQRKIVGHNTGAEISPPPSTPRDRRERRRSGRECQRPQIRRLRGRLYIGYRFDNGLGHPVRRLPSYRKLLGRNFLCLWFAAAHRRLLRDKILWTRTELRTAEGWIMDTCILRNRTDGHEGPWPKFSAPPPCDERSR